MPLRVPRSAGALSRVFPLICLLLTAQSAVTGADFSTEARAVQGQLRERILPYWYDTGVDWTAGGYRLCDDSVKGRCEPDEKQLVTQARMIWGFAHAHRHGLSTPSRDYLKVAAHGVRFLREKMRDPVHGGYFWSVTVDGALRDPRKRLYGESFVIYALVEYARAGRDSTALADALELYREIQKRAHDDTNRGWTEHFERDWTPLPLRAPEAIVEVAGLKSANTHLHLMEALTELVVATQDSAVKASLAEALELNQRYFYPSDAGQSAFHFQPDWSPVTDPSSAGLSYGHNVEFAWLMIQAERALGRSESWPHFHRHLRHALQYGTDAVRGGTYNRGRTDQPATDTAKVWWVQAEMFPALTFGLQNLPGDAAYADALAKLILWCNSRQTDPKSGIWLDTVTADGTPKATGLAHNWKANYHDVRGLVIFSDAFAPPSPGK